MKKWHSIVTSRTWITAILKFIEPREQRWTRSAGEETTSELGQAVRRDEGMCSLCDCAVFHLVAPKRKSQASWPVRFYLNCVSDITFPNFCWIELVDQFYGFLVTQRYLYSEDRGTSTTLVCMAVLLTQVLVL